MKARNLWLAVLVSALASGVICNGAENWVAEPGKSLNAEWPVPKFAGKDCWPMLWAGTLKAEGVKDEPFVKESGLYRLDIRQGGLETRHIQGRAALAVREISVFDDAGAALPSDAWKIKATSDRSDVKYFNSDALKDGEPRTAFAAVGDMDKQAFSETLPVVFTITLDKERGVGKIALRHGLQGKARAGKLSLSVKAGDTWKPVACARSDKGDSTELTLAKPEERMNFNLPVKLGCRCSSCTLTNSPARTC